MKEVFYIDDTPANKISYYFMLVFLVALPFDRLFSELALIGLLLHTLLHLRSFSAARGGDAGSAEPAARRERARLSRVAGIWSGWVVAAIYMLTIIATSWSNVKGPAFKDWEKQLALLLFPLIFYFTQLDWKKYRMALLKGLAFSCLFTLIYLYGMALYTIRSQGLPVSSLFSPPFMNHAFSAPIDLHATYFSMYIAISLVTFVWLIVQSRSPLTRWLYILASLILLGGILQLAARAVCIALLIILNGLLPFRMMKGRLRRNFFLASFLLSALSFVIVVNNESLHNRYLVSLKQDLHGGIGEKEDPEPRMARWICAWELIRASPWIGYGTGPEVGLLKEKYVRHQLNDSYAHELNAHNQYLSFLLEAGIIGGLFYLGALGIGFWQAFRRKDPFFEAFLVIIVCVSFSENILDVNKGIFFFSFFFSFFAGRPGVQEASAGRREPVVSEEPYLRPVLWK